MSSTAAKMTESPGTPTANEVIGTDESTHDRIARLAYSYWEARGRPNGSPEADWFRAAEEIRRQAETTPFDIVDEASEESFPASDAPAH